MIKRLLRRWLDEPTPEDGLAEVLAITVRCARRCAYDLAHAADMMPSEGWQSRFTEIYAERAKHWQGLFSSGASMKDYRIKMLDELEEKERIIEGLRKRIAELGGDPFLDGEVPF